MIDNKRLGEALAKRLQSGVETTVAGLGDSLTYGWMVSRGFFDRFIHSVEALFPMSNVRRINAGIPGDTARGGLMRLDRVLAERPFLVVVQFGLNDLYSGIDPESFAQDLKEIANRISAAGAEPVLATSCPLSIDDEQSAADVFYDAIRRTGRTLEVAVADLERHWLDASGAGKSKGRLYQADGVHPTDLGHALMAEGLFENILGGVRPNAEATGFAAKDQPR